MKNSKTGEPKAETENKVLKNKFVRTENKF